MDGKGGGASSNGRDHRDMKINTTETDGPGPCSPKYSLASVYCKIIKKCMHSRK